MNTAINVLGPQKREISCPAERLVDPQKELCSMELIIT
jgi:hypothetical protein